jgi:phosphate transport system protein
VEGHIVRTFDGEILDLRLQVLRMGGLAIDQVQRAVLALTGGDADGARDVVSRNAQVVAYARAVEDDIVGVIARRQPVASDLKAILTVGRAATDLERVGHAARKIGRLALELDLARDSLPLQRVYSDVRKMSRLALAMLRDALDCFDRVDLEGALAVVHRDAELDREFQLALRELVTYVMEDPRHLGGTIQTVFALKALERVGDHARNIAASVPRLARRGDLAVAAPPVPPVPARPAAGAGGAAERDPRVLGQG